MSHFTSCYTPHKHTVRLTSSSWLKLPVVGNFLPKYIQDFIFSIVLICIPTKVWALTCPNQYSSLLVVILRIPLVVLCFRQIQRCLQRNFCFYRCWTARLPCQRHSTIVYQLFLTYVKRLQSNSHESEHLKSVRSSDFPSSLRTTAMMMMMVVVKINVIHCQTMFTVLFLY